MERFFGFDLGDAESAVSCLGKTDAGTPQILKVEGEGSFITAYAYLAGGELLIGENACYHAGAIRRRLRFKSRFLEDKSSSEDIRSFASGVLTRLYLDGSLVRDEDCCFYVGCPAGWNKNAREEYRSIFERSGYPPVRIISESRAALVCACQSKHLQVGYDILSKPVLVVDIGSSTTDFAYICGGREVEMQTAGEVALGGGIMDELLLERAVSESPDADRIRRVFQESEPWRSYCEFAARKLKEKYFLDEAYWENNPCVQTIRILYDDPLRLTIRMDAKTAKLLTEGAAPRLDGASFRQVFEKSLKNVRGNIHGEQPELLFLTGGVSKLKEIRTWCADIFPESVIISGTEPEYSVSRGLAWSGRIDEQLREFKQDLNELVRSTKVEDLVRSHIRELYRAIVDTLVDPILENAALPVFEKWRSGEIRRLSDTDDAMQQAIEAYLRTEEAKELLVRPVAGWLRPVAEELEEYTVPICIRHNVPYTALSLSSYLRLSDIDIRIDAKNVFAVEEITWMIDSIISLMVGLLCGGSGIALISSGPTGIIAGMTLSLAVLMLGKGKMEEALLQADLPKLLRRIVPKNSVQGRMKDVSASVRSSLYDSLEKEKNEEIAERLTGEISSQIEQCLLRMAEVVEIPLGS